MPLAVSCNTLCSAQFPVLFTSRKRYKLKDIKITLIYINIFPLLKEGVYYHLSVCSPYVNYVLLKSLHASVL
jgi:uncharacterized protein (DUF2225 family)